MVIGTCGADAQKGLVMPEVVTCDVQNAVALVTLNRPDKLNALDRAVIDALLGFLDQIEGDERIRAVVLTGAGERAFSAGADIAGLAEVMRKGHRLVMTDFVRRGQGLTRRIEAFPKPIIVAVNGLAYGGGCEITEAAPLAIASERATFAKSEINLGFAPPFGGSQRLPRLIGRKRALRMILTGEPITAQEALAVGLVNEVTTHDALLERAMNLAQLVAAKSQLAVAACLGCVTRGLNVAIDEGLAIEAGYFERMLPTHDLAEGVSAWLERRPAEFVGR
jgi:enoyl-CoA hydratase/carnithine racemase